MRLVALCFAALLTLRDGAADDTSILLRPGDLDSPAIKSIVEGIQLSTAAEIVTVETLSDYSDAGRDDQRIIVLGSSLLEQASTLDESSIVVGGGFYTFFEIDERVSTFSLYPDIREIANEINKIGFGLKRIVTVVSSTRLQRYLEQSLDASNLSHSVHVAVSEQDVARSWFELLRDLNPSTDAILVSDATFLESSGAYRKILETAWRRNILVVSAIPQYATRGVSIGFVPDLLEYGKHLVEFLEYKVNANTGDEPPNINAMVDVLVRVFNKRTLSHIGYSLPDDLDQLNRVDVVIE